MNRYERAVIEAARAWYRSEDDSKTPLWMAIQDLLLHEREQAAAGITEADWCTLAAGDQVRGKSGTFYPVIAVQALATDPPTWQIRIDVAGKEKTITRPSEAEPRATVKRGPDGKAVDLFLNVLTSG